MTKGKNFSGNNVSGKRKKSDFYETPYGLTRLFLSREVFPESVLEPACGDGAIVKVLKEFDYNVTAFDLEVDFLKFDKPVSCIITNPPFSLALEFIKHAKQLTTEKFAFLLPLSYLHGKQRYDEVYTDTEFPLSKVYVFTRYPMLGDELRDDGKHRTGMMVYAWYLWDKNHSGPPIINWLDNHEYTIGARNLKEK